MERFRAAPLALTGDRAPTTHGIVASIRTVRPRLTGLLLAAADIAALAVAGLVAIYGRLYFDGQYAPSLYLALWPALGMFGLAYTAVGMYPGAPLSPPQEIRCASIATTLVFLAIGTLTFLSKDAELYSRGVLLIAWGIALVAVPLGRSVVRMLCAGRPWWGHGAVMIGVNPTTRTLVRRLRRQPELGLNPVAVYERHSAGAARCMRLPIVSDKQQLRALMRRRGVRYAILAPDEVPGEDLEATVEDLGRVFKHLMIIPQIPGMGTLWASGVDLGGTLGLRVEHRLLDRGRRALKRALDWLIVFLALPLLIPLMAGIALAIRLDSRGPVMFRQHRLGRGGRPFKIFKFRTMHQDAERALQQHLAEDDELRQQWEKSRKLKRDPRITRVGGFLRRTSLDELPQIFNVLAGQMSLVGPRPIVEEEIQYYGRYYEIYCQVMPGITGIWQASGRNEVSYSERVRMDVYYVRNWSVWLDLYLISRTGLALLLRRGAY